MVGTGVHPFGDPTIAADFEKVDTAIDLAEFHDHAAIWSPEDVSFYIGGEPTEHVDQSAQYRMQIILDIHDFGGDSDRDPAPPFIVDRLRIFEPLTGWARVRR